MLQWQALVSLMAAKYSYIQNLSLLQTGLYIKFNETFQKYNESLLRGFFLFSVRWLRHYLAHASADRSYNCEICHFFLLNKIHYHFCYFQVGYVDQ